jgi:hypothetical protein
LISPAAQAEILWSYPAERNFDDFFARLSRQQARVDRLMDKNSRGSVTDEEYVELQKLVEQGDRLMVRKAEAADLLCQRGYPNAD